MSETETAINAEAPAPGLTTRLMDSLIVLGESLPESHKPSPGSLSHLLAGLLYWLETGTTEPPVIEVRQPTQTSAKDAEIAQLRAELVAAQEAARPATVAPSAVVPPISSPTPAVPAGGQPVAPGQASSTEPAPVSPTEPQTPPVSEVPSAPAS